MFYILNCCTYCAYHLIRPTPHLERVVKIQKYVHEAYNERTYLILVLFTLFWLTNIQCRQRYRLHWTHRYIQRNINYTFKFVTAIIFCHFRTNKHHKTLPFIQADTRQVELSRHLHAAPLAVLYVSNKRAYTISLLLILHYDIKLL